MIDEVEAKRYDPPALIRASDLLADTAQTGGMIRKVAVDSRTPGVTKIWGGTTENEPGFLSAVHMHPSTETVGFVLKGKARIYWGSDEDPMDMSNHVDMDEGDFIFVPADIPHAEANRSQSEWLHLLTFRSEDNLVVNLEDVPRESLRVFE